MWIVVLLSIVTTVLAGTECPPRENIYPCSCVALKQGRTNYFTTVTCHRLGTADDLMAIVPSLRSMSIDHFYLYDSFWEAEKLEDSQKEMKQVLPTDWMTLLKIKELEIVDTILSPCFACQTKLQCRNSVTTRFTAVNSSSHEKICTLCDSNSGRNKFSWTGCLTKLRQFHFRDGHLTVVRADLFPMGMRELVEVDLSHNRIEKIEKDAFKNTPRLKVLLLSNNALQTLDAMFTNQEFKSLEELDVSWNLIKTVGNLFRSVPGLRAFRASNNMITDLPQSEWQSINNDKLREIDLTENSLHCDCSMLWVNSTFAVHVNILGHCSSPEDYEGSVIRKVSRLLASRCDGGTMGTRARTTKRPATKPYPGLE